MLLRPQQTRERGRPRPVLHARSTGEASGLGSRSRLGPCSPAPGRGWARAKGSLLPLSISYLCVFLP